MQTAIGFLSGGPTYGVTIPDGIAVSQEACSTLRVGGAFKSLQWADESAGAAMIESAGLHETGRRSSQAGNVTIYRQDVLGELDHTVLMFEPYASSIGFGRLWITLEADEDALVDTLVEHVSPYQDEHGVARVRVNGPVVLGNPLNPAERDIVSFFGPSVLYNVQVVQFANTGALGSDRGLNANDDTPSVTVATDYGVSITCQGGAPAAPALEARADAVATSFRRL